MKKYLGTKQVAAQPMNRLEYVTYRGWLLPEDEDGSDAGYLVEYLDGGKPNDDRHEGYISWSPKAQFEAAYRELQTVTRSYICSNRSDPGSTFRRCQKGDGNCNGYCESSAIRSPKKYELVLTDFGEALRQLKAGKKVARTGWNGVGMFLFLVPGSTFNVSRAPLLGIYPAGTEINYRPHIDIRTADGAISTWAPSNGDALAEDYYVVE